MDGESGANQNDELARANEVLVMNSD